jgi:hypothetical protein
MAYKPLIINAVKIQAAEVGPERLLDCLQPMAAMGAWAVAAVEGNEVGFGSV